MTETKDDSVEIDLRNPLRAAFWALLWPGSGHIYQRRYAKGILFMACILTDMDFFGGKIYIFSVKSKQER